ncbi:helix-turn-helix transcriptional regulator [Pseudomonas atacamensis]|uniref:helix-turn-helix transcriptional regulator n=1 Tax=Pseudomonas atacamensis TaxID=2565368 RepID=UPI001F277C5C|nr:helix-turn-helix transcriptional regulator [Pseudomonas atacamensis]
MTDTREFPERLAWARAERGLTQKELAEAAGISLVQVARYETGRSTPRLGAALKLARVLGLDAYDLMPELKKTTKEIEVQLSAEEAQQFDAEATKLGITTEELMRKLTMIGLRMRAKDPETRKMLEEEFPGMLERIDSLSDDDD